MLYNSHYLLKKLFIHYIKPYSNKICLAVFCMIIASLTNAAQVWLVKPVIDDVFINKDKYMLYIVPLAAISITIIRSISSYFQNYLMRHVGQRVITDMQIKLYNHLLYLDFETLKTLSSGKIISRFTNDIVSMRSSVSNLITAFANEILTLFLLVILMFYQNFTLSLITFIAFPTAIYPIIKLGRKMRRVSDNTQSELGNFTERPDETFNSIRIIRSYNREDFEVKRASIIMEKIFNLYMKAVKVQSISSPIIEMMSGITIAFIIWYGGMQVIEGHNTAGSFFTFVTAFLTAYKPVKNIANINNSLQEGLAAAQRLFDILDIQPKIIDRKNALDLKIENPSITFNSVYLNYGEAHILSNINLDINPGKIVAIVGESGSGKSSIINLLLRLYEPKSGSILIDGQNIQEITKKSLYSNISIVTQDILLFDDTVKNNLLYGKLDATDSELKEAALYADALEFIENMPKAFDSLVGQDGSNLSGGQKQRISIARAFLKNSPIMILDEATSSLDSISEKKIMNNIKNIRANKTTIIITHRLTTITDVDRIIVVDNGNIIETGTHEELIQKNGHYKILYEHQIISK